MTVRIICELQLTSRARFKKWLFKWAFDIISTRSSYSTIFSFNSRNICCLPNIKASCFCIDLQQPIYEMLQNLQVGITALLCAVSLKLPNLFFNLFTFLVFITHTPVNRFGYTQARSLNYHPGVWSFKTKLHKSAQFFFFLEAL